MSLARPVCSRCAHWQRCRATAASARTSPSSVSRVSFSGYFDKTSRGFCSNRPALQSSKRPLVTTATTERAPTIETTPPPPRNANPAAIPGANDLRYPEVSIDRVPPSTGASPSLKNVATADAFRSHKSSQKNGTQAEEAKGSMGQKLDSSATQHTQQTSAAVPKARPKLRALRAAIKLTPAAVQHVKALLDQPEPKLLRVGTRRRGCSGLAYHLEYVDKADKFDEVVKQDGIEILVESRALLTVLGTTMDWVDEKLGSRFVFNNPNIKEQCGCGESFMV